LQATKHLSNQVSFGYLIVNFITREAALKAFKAVDAVREGWPPYTYPRPRDPVRWAKLQGIQELQQNFGSRAFKLVGLPGSYQIPAGAHTFFVLPTSAGSGGRVAGSGGEWRDGGRSPGGVAPPGEGDPALLDRGQLKRAFDDSQVGFPLCCLESSRHCVAMAEIYLSIYLTRVRLMWGHPPPPAGLSKDCSEYLQNHRQPPPLLEIGYF